MGDGSSGEVLDRGEAAVAGEEGRVTKGVGEITRGPQQL